MRWGTNIYPYQPRTFTFDLPTEDPRATARNLGERLRRHLETESRRLIGGPTHQFRPMMENIIRSWLVYNAVEYREWTFDLTEIEHENSPSVWTLRLTLDQENIEIQFTLT